MLFKNFTGTEDEQKSNVRRFILCGRPRDLAISSSCAPARPIRYAAGSATSKHWGYPLPSWQVRMRCRTYALSGASSYPHAGLRALVRMEKKYVLSLPCG